MPSARFARKLVAATGLLTLSALIHAGLIAGLWRVERRLPPASPGLSVSWVQVMPPAAPAVSPETSSTMVAPEATPEPPPPPRPKRAIPRQSDDSVAAQTVRAVPASPTPSESAIAASADDFGAASNDQQTSQAASSEADAVVSVAQIEPVTLDATDEPEPPLNLAQASTLNARPETRQPLRSAPHVPTNVKGRWRYQIYYGDYSEGRAIGWLDYVLEIEGDRYRLLTEGQATGLTALLFRGAFRQTSSGRVSGAGFMPERYEERRGDRPPRGFQRDFEASRLLFDNGNHTEWVEGLQDRLSIIAQLSWMASQGLLSAGGKPVVIPLVGSSRVRPLRLEVLADQPLMTPDGKTLNTLAVRALPESSDDDEIDVWLQPKGPLLPLRIRFMDQRGRILDHFLSSP